MIIKTQKAATQCLREYSAKYTLNRLDMYLYLGLCSPYPNFHLCPSALHVFTLL